MHLKCRNLNTTKFKEGGGGEVTTVKNLNLKILQSILNNAIFKASKHI